MKDLAQLLEHLGKVRGTDFSGYKPASLTRRIQKRLAEVGVDNVQSYLDHLEVHPEEYDALLNTVLINVTAFFRDGDVWDYVATEVIPALVQAKPEGPIRMWVPGCASGEEAYTLAMLVAEVVGTDRFKREVKVFGTDLDDDALARARAGRYSSASLESVPERLRTRYFVQTSGDELSFTSELRTQLIFGRHDLTRDAPIRGVDVVSCRNSLMYFNADTQRMIAARLHFALEPHGVLILGSAEGLFSHSDLFKATSLDHRVFSKVAGVLGRDRLMRRGPRPGEVVPVARELSLDAFDVLPVAAIVVADDESVAAINAAARRMFGLSLVDLGRPLRDLEVSYRPAELRSRLEQARAEKRAIHAPNIQRTTEQGVGQVLSLDVIPLGNLVVEAGGGTVIVFSDETDRSKVEGELITSKRELQGAYEELQSTNEELETTNEELKSTIEELETTNEELQSTNEELETMNEELQSTNEEMQTVNDALHVTAREVARSKAFLESVLGGLDSGLIAVDRDLNIVEWNLRAEDQWGLQRSEVVGTPLGALDSGLPVDRLLADIRKILKGDPIRNTALSAVNRRGKTVELQVDVTPYSDSSAGVDGVIMLIRQLPV